MTSNLVKNPQISAFLREKLVDIICTGHFQAFDSLLRKLQKYVPFGASVADLYAGAGVIGLSLAASRKCRQELYCFCSFKSEVVVEVKKSIYSVKIKYFNLKLRSLIQVS